MKAAGTGRRGRAAASGASPVRLGAEGLLLGKHS